MNYDEQKKEYDAAFQTVDELMKTSMGKYNFFIFLAGQVGHTNLSKNGACVAQLD